MKNQHENNEKGNENGKEGRDCWRVKLKGTRQEEGEKGLMSRRVRGNRCEYSTGRNGNRKGGKT